MRSLYRAILTLGNRLSPTTLLRVFHWKKALFRYRYLASLQPQEIGQQLRDLGDGTFESLGEDPKFAVDLKPERRPRSSYRARLLGRAGQGAAQPILYMIDTAGGTADGVPLPPLAEAATPWATLSLLERSAHLRLDPIDRPGQFHLSRLELTSLNPRDRLVRLAKKKGWSQLCHILGGADWAFSWTIGGDLAPTDDGSYKSTGSDPFFLLYPLDDLIFGDAERLPADAAPARLMPSGWVRARIDATSDVALRPELYIDSGDGFGATPPRRLAADATGAEALIWLPRGIRRLRLDPFEGAGRIHLQAVTLTPCMAPRLSSLKNVLLRRQEWALSRFVFDQRADLAWQPAGGLQAAGPNQWISRVLDPYFHVVPRANLAFGVDAEGRVDHPQAAAFPAGWVTLHVDAEAALGDLRPELYIDTGGGFAAHPAILIDIDAARGLGALFWLPRGIQRMRFDPLAGIGTFTLRRLTLTALSHAAAARRLFGRYGFSPPAPKAHAPLSHPVGLEVLIDLEHRLTPLPVTRDDSRPATVNVLLPTLDASIVFGGYIAIFNFIVKLRDWGYRTRIVLCDSDHVDLPAVTAKLAGFPGIVAAIENAEWAFSGTRGGDIPASGQDVFVSFSVWTALLAHGATEAIGRQRHLFFIQEDERIFYENNSFRALAEQAYRQPHFALFNSALLRDHFRAEGLGVYHDGAAAGDAASASYAHALTAIPQPALTDLERGGRRRLFFYARPEAHAARNLFEIGVLALRRAITAGVFGREWEFVAIGSLGLSGDLPLAEGRVLEIAPRVDPDAYGRTLSACDIGLSLMYAPHPSVPPLEMASAGMVVVTTHFGARDADAMAALSANIIAVAPTVETVAAGLRQAAARVDDLPARVAGAAVAWPTDWNESFGPAVERAVRHFIEAS